MPAKTFSYRVSNWASTRENLPLSHASMVANSSLFFSMRSASLVMSIPRSVAGRRFHDGSLRALCAARTALSTSSTEAECTAAISASVLQPDSSATLAKRNRSYHQHIRRVDCGKLVALLTRHELVVDEEAGRLRPSSPVGGGQFDEKLAHDVRLLGCIQVASLRTAYIPSLIRY